MDRTDESTPGIGRGAVRIALDRDLDDLDEEAHVDKCLYRSCEEQFLGVTLEDFGVHLLTEHTHIVDQRRLYRHLVKAERGDYNRSVDTDSDHS